MLSAMGCHVRGHRVRAALVAGVAVWTLAAQKPNADPQLGVRLGEALQQAGKDLWGIATCAIDGKVVFEGARGLQDRTKVAIDGDSLFDLGGLADRITAIAVLELLAHKHWQIDEPVARALPEWPKDKAAITWRQLLQHTSGLPPEADWSGGRSAARRPAIEAIAATVLVDTPGHGFHWSPLNANMLALLLEQAGGADFEEVVRRRVLGPAGMTSAVFLGERKIDDKHLTWRQSGPAEPKPAREFPWDYGQRGARGLLASSNDLGNLGRALCGTKLLDGKQLAVLLQPLPGGDVLRVQSVLRAGLEWTQLHGAVAGYRARLLLLPKARSWIALLAGECDLDPLEAALAAAMAPALGGSTAAVGPVAAKGEPTAAAPTPPPVAAPPPVVQAPVGAAQVARFLGAFELPSGGRFEVVKDGDGIALLGLGLEASARLQFGRWPVAEVDVALRAAEDRSLAGLQPLVAGTGTPPTKCFAGDSALAAVRQAIDRIVARVGKGAELQFAGTETGATRQSWLRLVGRSGTAWLRVGWSTRGTIASLAESAEPAPFRLRLRIERPDWAVGAVGAAAITVSVEGIGAGRTLVVEDQGGIVECEWVADLR